MAMVTGAEHRDARSHGSHPRLQAFWDYSLSCFAGRESSTGAADQNGAAACTGLQIINAGQYKVKPRAQIHSSAYVVDTLEAALWAVYNTGSFEDAVLLAANLGDDADSVAAVAGQLAAAFYGESGIPERWVERLACSADIRSRADSLFRFALDCERNIPERSTGGSVQRP